MLSAGVGHSCALPLPKKGEKESRYAGLVAGLRAERQCNTYLRCATACSIIPRVHSVKDIWSCRWARIFQTCVPGQLHEPKSSLDVRAQAAARRMRRARWTARPRGWRA